MKKEYLKFTPEELIDDSEFIAWALRGKNQKVWEIFLADHPEFKTTVLEAQRIADMLQDDQDHINDEDILNIWKNIERFDTITRNRKHREIILRGVLRYAAVLAVILAVGGGGFWFSNLNHKTYVYKTNPPSDTGIQSRLILSNGTTINLEKENSKIALNSDEKIVLNNEKVIDLSDIDNPEESKMNEVNIPFGKKSQLLLEDGTKVWLNAGSRMAFPTKFNGKSREIFLEGEAYFEVAHNQNLPFIVNTSNISVKVLGTKFNLSAYKTDILTETVLIEGKVAIKKQSTWGFLSGETILMPNQKASFSSDNQTLTVKNEPDVESAIAWREGLFKFSHQSVNSVLNQLQRYYNVHFEFSREFKTNDVITGKLDLKESIEKVMVVLADVANIQYRIDGNKIYIEEN